MSFAPAAVDLTIVQTLKDTYGVTDNAFDDTFQRWITAVSGHFERYCNRPLVQRSFTETRNGNGKYELAMRQFPIVSVASVTVDGVAIPQKTTPTGSGYAFGDTVLYLSGYQFGCGIQNVVVVYTAGLFTNTAAAAGSDIEQAVIETVGTFWKRKDHVDQVSGSKGGASSSSFNPKDFPPFVQTVLNQLKLPVLPVD